MHACPPIDIPPHTTSSEFWEQFGESPAPRVIRGSAPADFWSEFGVSDPSSGGTYFGDVGLLSGSGRGGTPYTLTNPGYTPGIFRDLPSRFPIPDILAAINLRPVLSLGLNGTGERDIAHHYHPVTVMRLLVSIGALSVGSDRFPYQVSKAVYCEGLPRLLGRAVVEVVIGRGPNARNTARPETVKLKCVIDGYAAPITAGNFVDLCQRGFYNGLPLAGGGQRMPKELTDSGYLLSSGGAPDPVRSILLVRNTVPNSSRPFGRSTCTICPL